MKPEIKAQWIEALRSGEYKQTKGELRTPNGYCCLGVLTDLYLKKHNDEWEYNERCNQYLYLDCRFGLPEEVMVWADLYESDPYVYTDDTDHTLAHYNDNKDYSFEQIADLIEENL